MFQAKRAKNPKFCNCFCELHTTITQLQTSNMSSFASYEMLCTIICVQKIFPRHRESFRSQSWQLLLFQKNRLFPKWSVEIGQVPRVSYNVVECLYNDHSKVHYTFKPKRTGQNFCHAQFVCVPIWVPTKCIQKEPKIQNFETVIWVLYRDYTPENVINVVFSVVRVVLHYYLRS